jgi:hypothetical protein
MEFQETQNGEGFCSFHADGLGWRDQFPCCSCAHPSRAFRSDRRGRRQRRGAAGCKRSRHRSEHHQDYPYAAFWDWYRSIMGYTDASTEWVASTSENLLTCGPRGLAAPAGPC